MLLGGSDIVLRTVGPSDWRSAEPQEVASWLNAEPRIMGMTEMISRLVEVKGIPQAAKGFSLQFGAEPFEGADADLTWIGSDDDQVVPGKDGSASQAFGNGYRGIVAGEEMEGWLWPALILAPTRFFVRAEPLPEGVDPIWNAPVARRFVSARPTDG
jgi:hypothetical protein